MPDRLLEIGGFTPLTTIDFPGRLAAVVFCQGCPWRCRYCQNSHLIPRTADEPFDWGQVLAFLERRQGLLDGVVFSGGEPTLQKALPDAVRSVKAMGYQVGLHTAGPYPKRLEKVLPLVDWVGFDIKSLARDYAAITNAAGSGAKALTSARLVLESGVGCEFRTTVHPALLDGEDLLALARALADMGVEHYVLQECVTEHCLDGDLRGPVATRVLDSPLTETIALMFPDFSLRRA